MRSSGGLLRRSLRRVGDRLVRATEDYLHEDLEGRIRGLLQHTNEAGFDPFGFDPQVGKYALAMSALLYRKYFRSEVHGIENVPPGRVLVVANHSGQLPFDGMMIGTSLVLDAKPPRLPRSMVEKWSAQLPFVSTLFARSGQVIGSPENARRLLQNDESLLVFPEGVRGISKPFDERYHLQEFGAGFMRLALETNTPILPVAVVGAEEQYISVADFKPLARLLGLPSFPIVPQLLVSGLLPLPSKYRLYFGKPLTFSGDPDDEDTVVGRKVSEVRSIIQDMVDRGLRERQSVFFT